MADSAGSDSLIRPEPQVPAPDPITSKSTSAYVLVGTLSLMLVLGWALYDEMYGLRPWKSMQQEFVEREDAFLRRSKRQAKKSETEIKASPEFQKIALDAKEARDSAAPALKDIDSQVKQIDSHGRYSYGSGFDQDHEERFYFS